MGLKRISLIVTVITGREKKCFLWQSGRFQRGHHSRVRTKSLQKILENEKP